MNRPCKYDDVGPGTWGQDLGCFLPSAGEAVGVVERLLPQISVTAARREPMPRPVCRMFDRCEGCPYPAHGFVCWGQDGGCLRSEMEKICSPKEMMMQ